MNNIIRPEPQERYLVLMEINTERERQENKWGHQSHPIRSIKRELELDKLEEKQARLVCNINDKDNTLSWYDILLEEVREVFSTSDLIKQREELKHVAAVAVAAIQDIDEKGSSR